MPDPHLCLAENVLASTRKFAYDGMKVIAEFDGSDKLLKSYLWDSLAPGGVGGLREVREHDILGGITATYRVVSDENGNVRTLVLAEMWAVCGYMGKFSLFLLELAWIRV